MRTMHQGAPRANPLSPPSFLDINICILLAYNRKGNPVAASQLQGGAGKHRAITGLKVVR